MTLCDTVKDSEQWRESTVASAVDDKKPNCFKSQPKRCSYPPL